MASDEHSSPSREKEEEAERYRQVADVTLEHLQWCINYLYSIHKDEVARGLAKNRATIIEQLEAATSRTR
jgi:hypothetical protein